MLAASGWLAGRAARADILVLRLGSSDPRAGVAWAGGHALQL